MNYEQYLHNTYKNSRKDCTLPENTKFHYHFPTTILVNQYIIILGTENLIKTDQQVHTCTFPLSSTLQAFQGR